MRKTILSSALAMTAGLTLFAGSALALPALNIDFRDAVWAPAYGEMIYTPPGSDVTVNGWDGYVTNDPADRDYLYWDNVDGFGVKFGSEYDEIENYEWLQVEFDSPVTLQGFALTDLFDYPDGNTDRGEYGWADIFNQDGMWIYRAEFWGDGSSGNNGEQYVNAYVMDVSEIRFGAAPWPNSGTNNEFSVAGINAIPEPATMLLFGTGLAGLAGISRRRKK